MILKIAVGVTSTLIQAAQERRVLVLQNQSDTDIYITLDGSSDVTVDSGAKPGIKITPGGAYLATREVQGETALSLALYAIHGGTGTKNLVCHII